MNFFLFFPFSLLFFFFFVSFSFSFSFSFFLSTSKSAILTAHTGNNHGTQSHVVSTRITYMGFKGTAKAKVKRGIVKNAVYEIQGAPEDVETPDDEKMLAKGLF